MRSKVLAVTDYDLIRIRETLTALQAKSPAKQMPYSDIDTAMKHIEKQAQQGLAYMVEGYLILTDIGTIWYSNETFLLEDMVLKVYDKGVPPSIAAQALTWLAEQFGVRAVIAGDAQVGLMGSYYEAEGFSRLGTQYIKEI